MEDLKTVIWSYLFYFHVYLTVKSLHYNKDVIFYIYYDYNEINNVKNKYFY